MKTLLTLAAIAALTPLAPALADAPARQVVAFDDLDLGSPADRVRLDRRIARAADTVCGTASGADLAGQNALRRCRVATTVAAERDLTRTIAARQTAVEVAAR